MSAHTTFSPPSTPSALRAELLTLVLSDLLGPAGGPEEEVDEDRVFNRYLVGMLAPRDQAPVPDLEDELVETVEDDPQEGGTPDIGAAQVGTMMPSSMGLSFCVDGATRALEVTLRWGRYLKAPSATARNDASDEPKRVWKRSQIEACHSLPLAAEGPIGPLPVSSDTPEVLLQGEIRRRDDDWAVSLFLVNSQPEPKRERDAAWIFQPEISVRDHHGAPVFIRRMPPVTTPGLDELALAERATMEMLYRHHVEFAVGHGVAVHATVAPGDTQRAIRLDTRVAPAFEVPAQSPPTAAELPALAGLVLDMQSLAELSDEALVATLNILADAYAAWIDERSAELQSGHDGLAPHAVAGAAALEGCDTALARIRTGIQVLSSDPRARSAFRFANRAMAMQRVRGIYALSRRRGGSRPLNDFDTPENRSWRPFQLAFFLLNLPSLTDIHHPERSAGADATADLLWFPTGGGKTEAYLGLTAYTLAMRRLQGQVEGRSGEHGVAVLMRYTLRALTLQQFQRAAALLCACEVLRRDTPSTWGSVPFRLGLWVGYRTTPNTTADSHAALLRDHGEFISTASGSPVQIRACPWCGCRIDPGQQHVQAETRENGRGRTFIYCGDPVGQCEFSAACSPGEGLPVLVVDEEIYRNPPSLLIATVDKFAQMAWKGPVQTLFGQVGGRCPRHGFRSPDLEDSDSHPPRGRLGACRTEPHVLLRPPDLIIQDELHLISGPLGTLVGLYETAVDTLCSWSVGRARVRPKVIASTATIRRAGQQAHSLFQRELRVFPPHGLDIADNFFARQRPVTDLDPGRLYLGVCAIGRRFPLALIRVYLAFLSAGRKLYDGHQAGADPWMTLVGYFNALRELGAARRLVEDDVRSRLRRMPERGLPKRTILPVQEMTSRIRSTEIPEILDRLEIPFTPEGVDRRSRQRRRHQPVDAPPLDVLLATNMLSVGVDVNRLGLMVVAGQPKTTAEYIQATSRVGRQRPGLVCTIFNWARPRDLSHYERFDHYHATFYQHVEPLSVTPFAPRALDRALTGLLVSLVRQSGLPFNANAGAGALRRDDPIVHQAVEAIVARARLVTGETQVGDAVRQQLMDRLDAWQSRVLHPIAGQGLAYQAEAQAVALLNRPGSHPFNRFTCLNSLREVEPQVRLIMQVADPSEQEPAITPASEIATAEAT